MGTDSGAVYLDPGGTFEHYHPGNSPLSVDEVRSVALDDQGGVWFGTWAGGAHYLDTEGKWSTYTRQDSGLPGNSIYPLLPGYPHVRSRSARKRDDYPASSRSH